MLDSIVLPYLSLLNIDRVIPIMPENIETRSSNSRDSIIEKEKNNEKVTITKSETTDSSHFLQSEVYRTVEEAVQTSGYYTYMEERKLLRKIDFHLMPMLILLYLFKNLDVNNVSYLVTLNKGTKYNILEQLGMTTNEWAWVSTIYFIPFVIFEIPSTMLLKKTTPRIHQFRIALLWGATTACQAAVKNKEGLYALRFLLGLFEAGLYPSQLTHLTYWYRPDEITTRMAFLGVLGSFSSVLTAFITYGFSFASGHGNLSAWQYVFLIEGLATLCVAVLGLFFLPNFPDTSKWLSDEEKAYIIARLPPSSPKSTDKNFSWKHVKASLKRPTLVLFAFLRLFQSLGTYGLSFWLPSIILEFGITKASTTPLMTVPSAAMSVISGILFSYGVDRAKITPPYLVAFSLTITFAAFLVLTLVTNSAVLYAFIILATVGASADGSVMSSWMNQSLDGSTEVGFSLSFANSVAQLGGIIGPQMFRSRYSPRYTVPYSICLAFLASGIIVLSFLWYLTRSTTKKTFEERRQRLQERSRDKNERPIYNTSIPEVEVSLDNKV